MLVGLLGMGCGQMRTSAPKNETAAAAESSLEIPLLQGDGETLDMDSLRGQIVLLDFCATWSAPSRMGVKDLNELQSELADSGLKVLGLCVDDGERDSVSDLVAGLGADYSVGWADPTVQEWFGGVRPIPTRILLDREGNEVDRFEGAVPIEKLKAALMRLLDSAVSPQS